MPDYEKISKTTHVAFIHETWGQSFRRDATTAAVFLFLWSIGHYVGSPALEWVGVAFGGGFVFLWLLRAFKERLDNRMSPDEARQWLDAKFPRGDDDA